MKASEQSQLITLVPSETLSFKLGKNVEAKEILRVTNSSDNKVAFKVKTTQPSWYYVRPNQQILNPGQSEDVLIVLVEAEASRFLQIPTLERNEKFDKHRFLVQSKVIDDAVYEKLQSLQGNDKSEEFAKLWASNAKDDKKNIKLKVDFVFEEESNAKSDVLPKVGNFDEVKSKLSKGGSTSNLNGASNETLLAELNSLKKKYDAVVEYTVHLTAERDTILSQLEEMQKSYNREKQPKKDGITKTASSNSNYVESTAGHFSIYVIIVVSIIAFVAGKYLVF